MYKINPIIRPSLATSQHDYIFQGAYIRLLVFTLLLPWIFLACTNEKTHLQLESTVKQIEGRNATPLTLNSQTMDPKAGISSIEELISFVKSQHVDSNLLCADDNNDHGVMDIEIHGRCVKLISQVPRDSIQSIHMPDFTTPSLAEVPNSELIIGVSINGDHRAYSVPFLSLHEIVNDVVGDKPIAITW